MEVGEGELGGGEHLVDQGAEPHRGHRAGLDLGPAGGGLGPLPRVPLEPRVDLAPAAGQDLASLVDAGGAHGQLTAAIGQRTSTLVEPGPGRGESAPLLDALGLLVLEDGEERLELGAALGLAADATRQVLAPAPQLVDLGGSVAAPRLDPLERVARSAEDGVVGVELLGRRVFVGAGHAEVGVGRGDGSVGLLDRGRGVGGALAGLVQRGAGGAGAGAADAPARGAEPVAGPGDDQRVGVSQRHVDRSGPAAVDRDRVSEQAVEERLDAGAGRADVTTHRLALGDGEGRGAADRAEREHRALRVA